MIYLLLTASGDSEDTALIEVEKFESYYSNASSAEGLEDLKNEGRYLSQIKNPTCEVSLDESQKQMCLDEKKYMKKKERILEAIENELTIIRFIFYGMLKIFSKPWEILLHLIMPKSSKGIYLFIQFLIPLFLIWNVSELELYLLEKLIKKFELSANFVGLTITAWGNNSPDLFNVISAMEKGMVDLAINASIASQVHNILLGLGLPWLVYNLKFHKPLVFTSGGSIYAFTLFFTCIFILLLIIGLKLNKTRFNHKIAIFLFIVYLAYLVMLYVIIFVFKRNN
jgi:Ca2+/Na+ antiporter